MSKYKLITFANGVAGELWDDISRDFESFAAEGYDPATIFVVPAGTFTDRWVEIDDEMGKRTSPEPLTENPFLALDEDTAMDCIRALRDVILTRDVDPIVTNPLRWNALTEAEQTAWSDYRQALLDVPEQEGAPFDVVWPVVP